MLYEQLPVSGRHTSSVGSNLGNAGQQGQEGGAAAPSCPNGSLGSHQGPASPSESLQSGGEAATFAGIPVNAMEDVMAERMRQIVQFGHTAEADRETPLWSHREFTELGRRSFVKIIAGHVSSAIEYASFGREKYPLARRYLVKTAALCLAAIDRIDAELPDDQDA